MNIKEKYENDQEFKKYLDESADKAVEDYMNKMEDMLEITKDWKPCPFCGSKPIIWETYYDGYYLACTGCELMYGSVEDEGETIEDLESYWNATRYK